jgi:osmoprotectant transport system ATP-binding protein
VLSPTGQAVAVDRAGQVLGVAGQETVAAAIRAARQRRAADAPQDASELKAAR